MCIAACAAAAHVEAGDGCDCQDRGLRRRNCTNRVVDKRYSLGKVVVQVRDLEFGEEVAPEYRRAVTDTSAIGED